MTKRAARGSKGKAGATKFAREEYVRIVPLHYPKPAISLEELAARGRAGKGGELFDGGPGAAPAGAHLSYNGGALLTNVEVFTIFWGGAWQASATAKTLRDNLNAFFKAILTSSLITQLGEYSVPGKTIGPGKWLGSKVIAAGAPVGSVTDSAIKAQLGKWIKAKAVPPVSKNTLYFIYLSPGVVSIMGGSKSCQNYCGYHNDSGKTYYAVMPYPGCNGCLGGLSVLDALTGTSSHELCEAITDPVPGKGWYDNVNGEIGDICAWNFKKVAGYNVQLEWSNQANKCV